MALQLPKLSKELGLKEPGPTCNQKKFSRDYHLRNIPD